jgi:hypothetical protein
MNLGELQGYLNAEARKDKSGGYLKPSVFNPLLDKANLELFREELEKYEANQMNSDAMRPFAVTLGDIDEEMIPKTSGYYEIPEDYRALSSLRLVEASQVQNAICKGVKLESRSVEVLNDDQFNVRRGSTLMKPTIKKPIATIQNNKFRVLPDNYTHLGITYIRQPKKPFFDYTSPVLDEPDIIYLPPGSFHDGTVKPVGTPSDSVEIEWPEQMHDKFAEKCLYLLLRSLRDQWAQTAKG